MEQMTLPYVKNSPTSKAAAVSMEPYAASDKEWIYQTIKWWTGNLDELGITCDKLEEETGLIHQTASARVRGLAKAGRIKDSGMTRPTRSGRKAVVWVTADV